MASSFSRILGRRLAIASGGAGAAGLTINEIRGRSDQNDPDTITPAEEQFHTSSLKPAPRGWTGRIWNIRLDYPTSPAATLTSGGTRENLPPISGPDLPLPGGGAEQNAPWLGIDFKKDPARYCAVIKEYCWEGNANNEFVVQDNHVRDWYHAPWMHWSSYGREPLNGFTFERPTPPLEFSRTQQRYLQTWACAYYNSAGASLFGRMWANPGNPQWNTDYKFPLGTCAFKILMTDATDAELPSMRNSPSMKAVIAPTAADPTRTAPNPITRNDFASDLRLLQADFAVRDDRSPIGWVFGTFMYNGAKRETNAWDRIIPVGLMWGNDPSLNQAAFDNGAKPVEAWINPEADTLRTSLGGKRPSWGWNGRLNGPADNFISSCASCHSVSQKTGESEMVQPKPIFKNGKYIPVNDKVTMNWFRNIPAGKPFTPNSTSGDYSLQLMIGYHNYQNWLELQRGPVASLLARTKMVVGLGTPLGGVEKREGLRNGPDMRYDDVE